MRNLSRRWLCQRFYTGRKLFGSWWQLTGRDGRERRMSMERKTSTRGFASMEREKQREIARKGGRSVPHEKRSFSQNHQLAVEAGRKGGHSPGRRAAG